MLACFSGFSLSQISVLHSVFLLSLWAWSGGNVCAVKTLDDDVCIVLFQPLEPVSAHWLCIVFTDTHVKRNQRALKLLTFFFPILIHNQSLYVFMKCQSVLKWIAKNEILLKPCYSMCNENWKWRSDGCQSARWSLLLFAVSCCSCDASINTATTRLLLHRFCF